MSVIKFRQAEFMLGAAAPKQFPSDDGVEVAFAGYSNVGKSSALNTLCEQKSLARFSKTPGRTQQLNFFSLGSLAYRLVDFPGYGFAKAGKATRARWEQTIASFLEHRECLRVVVVLMDVRHPLKPFDCDLVQWASESNIYVRILLTKADKLKKSPAMAALQKVKHFFAANPLVSCQLFSSLKKTGVEDLQQYLTDKMLMDTSE
ncbi:MAG: ribosome biogenesis GTP-binding protein YihA/YsxC [Gammaproteobacteria bacterium]